MNKIILFLILILSGCTQTNREYKLFAISQRQLQENKDQIKSLNDLFLLNQNLEEHGNVAYVKVDKNLMDSINQVHKEIELILDRVKNDQLSFENAKLEVTHLALRLTSNIKSNVDYNKYLSNMIDKGMLALEVANLEHAFLKEQGDIMNRFVMNM